MCRKVTIWSVFALLFFKKLRYTDSNRLHEYILDWIAGTVLGCRCSILLFVCVSMHEFGGSTIRQVRSGFLLLDKIILNQDLPCVYITVRIALVYRPMCSLNYYVNRCNDDNNALCDM